MYLCTSSITRIKMTLTFRIMNHKREIVLYRPKELGNENDKW